MARTLGTFREYPKDCAFLRTLQQAYNNDTNYMGTDLHIPSFCASIHVRLMYTYTKSFGAHTLCLRFTEQTPVCNINRMQ